jgi:hypothetical protein
MSTAKTIELHPNTDREKHMDNESLSIRILDWILVRLPALPFATAIVFLYIYQEYHYLWAFAWLLSSVGIFLMLPGWLLIFRPNITLAFINAVYFSFGSRRSTIPAEPPIKKNWKHLKTGHKGLVITICVIAFLGGLIILGSGLQYLR